MSEIKAINTFYDGHKFRSRLEARWAVFFKNSNIKYEYEAEGFTFDGINYLPDFVFHDFYGYETVYGEVKPKGYKNIYEDGELDKYEIFCLYSVYPVIELFGNPEIKDFRVTWPIGWNEFYGTGFQFGISELQRIAIKKANEARFEFGEKPS